MNRDMYDATSANIGYIPHNARMVAGYDTGTPDIKWTDLNFSVFPQATKVHINQGYQSPARITSDVIDVESGAWQPGEIMMLLISMEDSGVKRPTVYCSRSSIPQFPVLPKVYDLWVAWPGYSGNTAPHIPGWNVVAVQHTYVGTFDISTVYDPVWPERPAAPLAEADMISQEVTGEAFIPFPAGVFKAIHLYRDFVSTTDKTGVRLAFHVSADQFHVIDVDLSAPAPVVIDMPAATVDAVTVSVTSGRTPIGFTLV